MTSLVQKLGVHLDYKGKLEGTGTVIIKELRKVGPPNPTFHGGLPPVGDPWAMGSTISSLQ